MGILIPTGVYELFVKPWYSKSRCKRPHYSKSPSTWNIIFEHFWYIHKKMISFHSKKERFWKIDRHMLNTSIICSLYQELMNMGGSYYKSWQGERVKNWAISWRWSWIIYLIFKCLRLSFSVTVNQSVEAHPILSIIGQIIIKMMILTETISTFESHLKMFNWNSKVLWRL